MKTGSEIDNLSPLFDSPCSIRMQVFDWGLPLMCPNNMGNYREFLGTVLTSFSQDPSKTGPMTCPGGQPGALKVVQNLTQIVSGQCAQTYGEGVATYGQVLRQAMA